jgi:hypothetical protein
LAADRRWASPSTLARILDEKPPAAVLVGYERDDDWHIDLDGILVAYAASRDYREISVPDSKIRLFLNPHLSASCF